MKKLGEKIWRLREEKGLSQELLAEKLEVSRQTVSNWENDRATPDAYKLKQLCEALEVSADELFSMGEDIIPRENGFETHSENNGSVSQDKKNKNILRKVLLFILIAITAGLLAVAIVLFTLPEKDNTQVITSAFTLTPTMGGIFLLVLSAFLIITVTILLLKKK